MITNTKKKTRETLPLIERKQLGLVLECSISPQCTARAPTMDHLRAYIGFSYIKYSRTSFIPFYYITEVLNLRLYTRRPSWAARRPKRPISGGLSGGPAA
jgi:hypothetical protein